MSYITPLYSNEWLKEPINYNSISINVLSFCVYLRPDYWIKSFNPNYIYSLNITDAKFLLGPIVKRLKVAKVPRNYMLDRLQFVAKERSLEQCMPKTRTIEFTLTINGNIFNVGPFIYDCNLEYGLSVNFKQRKEVTDLYFYQLFGPVTYVNIMKYRNNKECNGCAKENCELICLDCGVVCYCSKEHKEADINHKEMCSSSRINGFYISYLALLEA